MFNINHLKRRINSIAKTQKITYAMRLVARSLYNRTDKRRAELLPFINGIKSIFKLFNRHRQVHEPLRTTSKPIPQQELVILVSSSKGLCGGFHESLKKFFKQRFKPTQNQQLLIKIGQKTHLVGGTHITTMKTMFHYEAITAQNVQTVAEEIMRHVYEQNYKTVRLFSNRFVNFFSYKPTETILYPLTGLSELDAKEQSVRHIISHTQKAENAPYVTPVSEEFETEQDFHLMQNTIFEQYGICLLTNLLIESLMSEQSARFVSMDAATKNASSVLDKLKLQCNKLRQTLITREVAELSRSL